MKKIIQTLGTGLLSLVFAWQFVSAANAADAIVPSKETATTAETQPAKRIEPVPSDGRVAAVTAWLLEQAHYSRRTFDDKVSGEFLDGYILTLDPQHLHFLKSDIAEFERYRTNLDDLTLTPQMTGDTKPAFEIFARFLQRLEQRAAYTEELLKQEKFDFASDDRVEINRREAAFPKDLDEAKDLWRQRVRYDYLQEKLGLMSAQTNSVTSTSNTLATSSTNTVVVDGSKTNSTSVTSTGPVKSQREQIVDTLSHRYHRILRMFRDWDHDDVMGAYLMALAHVYDPHSDYLNREHLQSFSIQMNLALFGIGAKLSSTEDGYCKIEELMAGGPAIKSKEVSEGDRIVAVAQAEQPPVDVVEMSLNKVVQLIRGAKGTEVRLTIIPAGADASTRKIVKLVRNEIPLEESEAKARIIEFPNPKGGTVRLGVIDLPSFYASMNLPVGRERPEQKSTTTDVSRLLKRLNKENVSGVILDLRRNGGGSLEEAIKLVGLFIKQGPVVQVREAPMPGEKERITVERDQDPSVLYDGPLMVLTSRFSASASEIVAGALQDYGRALIVGDSSTHGKGTVQSLTSLRGPLHLSEADPLEPGALKVTIRKFYRASGASTQLRGITPDIVLPSLFNDSKEVGESSLENPLPWDTIDSAKYDKLDLVQPYVPDLLKQSNARTAKSKDYDYVREDIAEYQEHQSDKTISLNEKQRLTEADEVKARHETRQKERTSRKPAATKTYEVTLKQVDQPGLTLVSPKETAVTAQSVSAAAGTNSASVASAEVPKPRRGEDATDEESWRQRTMLDEAERIMVDYLSLLPSDSPVAVTPVP